MNMSPMERIVRFALGEQGVFSDDMFVSLKGTGFFGEDSMPRPELKLFLAELKKQFLNKLVQMDESGAREFLFAFGLASDLVRDTLATLSSIPDGAKQHLPTAKTEDLPDELERVCQKMAARWVNMLAAFEGALCDAKLPEEDRKKLVFYRAMKHLPTLSNEETMFFQAYLTSAWGCVNPSPTEGPEQEEKGSMIKRASPPPAGTDTSSGSDEEEDNSEDEEEEEKEEDGRGPDSSGPSTPAPVRTIRPVSSRLARASGLPTDYSGRIDESDLSDEEKPEKANPPSKEFSSKLFLTQESVAQPSLREPKWLHIRRVLERHLAGLRSSNSKERRKALAQLEYWKRKLHSLRGNRLYSYALCERGLRFIRDVEACLDTRDERTFRRRYYDPNWDHSQHVENGSAP